MFRLVVFDRAAALDPIRAVSVKAWDGGDRVVGDDAALSGVVQQAPAMFSALSYAAE
jgi:hypothetical protein